MISESFPSGFSAEAQKRFERDRAEPDFDNLPLKICNCERPEFTFDFKRGLYCLNCEGAPPVAYWQGRGPLHHMGVFPYSALQDGIVGKLTEHSAAVDPSHIPFVKFSKTVEKAAALIPADKRPSFEWVWMETAKLVRLRGTCPRLKVGAVLVYGNEVIATGYNGAPKRAPHCIEVGCDIEEETGRCKRTVHAEANCILQSAPQERLGADLYVTAFPCVECCALIANSGIRNVLYLGEYETQRDKKQRMTDMLEKAGVHVMQWLEVRE